jgi:hypothetical protein
LTAETKCPYREECVRFAGHHFHDLDQFLDWSNIQCYCARCYSGPATIQCGDPERACVVPIGCVRIPLHAHEAIFLAHNVRQLYYVCYHGTDLMKAKSIIDCGHLLQVGDVQHTGAEIELPEQHIEDNSSILMKTQVRGEFGPKYKLLPRDARLAVVERQDAQVHTPSRYSFTSPSLKYALTYSPKTDWGSDAVQVCMQMMQDPRSINVLHSTQIDFEPDPLVCDDEVEWFTDRRYPATVCAALIVKVVPHGELSWLGCLLVMPSDSCICECRGSQLSPKCFEL